MKRYVGFGTTLLKLSPVALLLAMALVPPR